MYRGERWNTITHLIGTLLALAGFAILVVSSSLKGDPWKIVSFSIYSATLVALYFFSTLYHGVRGSTKAFFRKMDHTAIYLLIAGTYTPFTLVTLRGSWGWTLFGVIWGLAFLGIVQEVLVHWRRRFVSVAIYLAMGWLVLVAGKPLLQALPGPAIIGLVAGGLCYSIGVVFFALDTRISYGHEIFHLLVLAGSVCHYFTILLFVA